MQLDEKGKRKMEKRAYVISVQLKQPPQHDYHQKTEVKVP